MENSIYKNRGLRASMVDKEEEEEEERSGNDAPGGGSVRRSLRSFCIRRSSLAAWAIFTLLGFWLLEIFDELGVLKFDPNMGLWGKKTRAFDLQS